MIIYAQTNIWWPISPLVDTCRPYLNDVTKRGLTMTIGKTTHAQWVVQPTAPWLGPQIHSQRNVTTVYFRPHIRTSFWVGCDLYGQFWPYIPKPTYGDPYDPRGHMTPIAQRRNDTRPYHDHWQDDSRSMARTTNLFITKRYEGLFQTIPYTYIYIYIHTTYWMGWVHSYQCSLG